METPANIPDELPEASRPPANRLSRILIRLAIILGLLAGLFFAGRYAWNLVYLRFFEDIPPVINVTEPPAGIGTGKIILRAKLSDYGSGLDEVVIRLRQKGSAREVMRENLAGKNVAVVDVPADLAEVSEGNADLEIRAFDRSLWNNASEKIFRLSVDFRKPHVEVVTSQHNGSRGGCQLIVYRAWDNDLASSGVLVGEDRFPGMRAQLLDPDLADSKIMAAIYGIPLKTDPKQTKPRLYSEDKVGNRGTARFHHTVWNRHQRKISSKIDSTLLGTAAALFRANLDKLGDSASAKEPVAQFRAVNEELRARNQSELVDALTVEHRYESFWQEPFLRPGGTEQSSFGDIVSFNLDGTDAGQYVVEGIDFGAPAGRPVLATNGGRVLFTGNIGVYGKVVIIDHGFRVATVYGSLGDFSVKVGQIVVRGQTIGSVGQTGLGRNSHLYYEMRANEVAVDPREWWDERWFNPHILKKIKESKRTLGVNFRLPSEITPTAVPSKKGAK